MPVNRVKPIDRQGSGRPEILLILPAGAFGRDGTRKIATIDANADAYPDLPLVSTGKAFAGGRIQLLIDRGDGSFVVKTLARPGPRATVLNQYGRAEATVSGVEPRLPS
jgi:hypothetical protein